MIPERQLAEITGRTTFEKGKKLFHQGFVYIEKSSSNALSGTVTGTLTYQVNVKKQHDFYDLNCSCPAFEYQEICKHCVALILAYNSSGNGKTLTNKTPEQDTPNQQLQSYLNDLPKQELATALFELINTDRKLYKRWCTKAKLATSSHDIKSLKKMVTQSLPLRSIWRYEQASEYFANAQSSLEDILYTAQKLPAKEQLQLIMKIFERIDTVLERIDDSGGFRYGLLDILCSELPVVISKQNWDKQQKAQWLYQLLQQDYEGVPEIPNKFALTDDELNAFFELCQHEFNNIDVATDIAQREYNFQLQQLGSLLISNRSNDFDFNLKTQSKMAYCFHDALRICEFCLDNDDELTAEDWLTRAKMLISEQSETSRWQWQAVKVYAALGETNQAWQIAWLLFTQRSGFADWQKLQQQIELIQWQPKTLKEDVEAVLIAACNNDNSSTPQFRAINNLIEFYFSEQRFEKGCEWIERYNADEIILAKASYRLAEDLPEKAIMYGSKFLDKTLAYSSNRSYEEAVAFLTSLNNKLPDNKKIKEKFQALIRNVAETNRRRPNMMKLLRAELSQYL